MNILLRVVFDNSEPHLLYRQRIYIPILFNQVAITSTYQLHIIKIAQLASAIGSPSSYEPFFLFRAIVHLAAHREPSSRYYLVPLRTI